MNIEELFNSVPADSRPLMMCVVGMIALALLIGIVTTLYFIIKNIVMRIRKNKQERLAREKAQERYEDIVGIGKDLYRKLSTLLQTGKEPFDMIVEFFTITSPISDQIDNLFDEKRYLTVQQYEQASAIISVVHGMGRDRYGWNRTKGGQPVTSNDVYLGNINGIFTKTVSYWKANRHKLNGFHENTYRILEDLALEFMTGNTDVLKLHVG